MFVLQQKEGKINGKTCIFFEVCYSNEEGEQNFQLMDRVSLKADLGWIPTTSLSQAHCRCPTVSFTSDENEAHPFFYIFIKSASSEKGSFAMESDNKQ